MNDLAPVIPRLEASRNCQELRVILDETCEGIARILNVTLLCSEGSPSRRLCVIDFYPGNSDLGLIAHRLGGKMFGFNSIVVSLALAPEFDCPRNASPSKTAPCSCTVNR